METAVIGFVNMILIKRAALVHFGTGMDASVKFKVTV